MIPSTLPQAAWWPLVGAALAHLVGDRGDEQHCRRAAIRALVDRCGMPELPAASLLVLHAAEAEDEARRIAVDWSRFLGELGAVYGTTPEPPMPNEVCPDPIVHGRQPLRDEFGRHPIVQDTRRCHYCAGWISPGDRHA